MIMRVIWLPWISRWEIPFRPKQSKPHGNVLSLLQFNPVQKLSFPSNLLSHTYQSVDFPPMVHPFELLDRHERSLLMGGDYSLAHSKQFRLYA